MYETTQNLTPARRTTRRTWLAVGTGLAAVLALLILVAAACQARSDGTDPVAGPIGPPSATPTAETADPAEDQTGGSGGQPGPAPGDGGSQGDDGGGPSGGGDGGEDPENPDPEESDDPLVVIPDLPQILPKLSASTEPVLWQTTDCDQATNVTVEGTITAEGGFASVYPVTVEYRWLLDGEPGLAASTVFQAEGEKAVNATLAMTGSGTVAIEILTYSGSTSDPATISLVCV